MKRRKKYAKIVRDIELDLSKHAGKDIALELINASTQWYREAASWADIKLVTE